VNNGFGHNVGRMCEMRQDSFGAYQYLETNTLQICESRTVMIDAHEIALLVEFGYMTQDDAQIILEREEIA